MSSEFHSWFEKPHDDDPFGNIFPSDEYNHVGLHFQALYDLGYPVEIEPVPVDEVRELYDTQVDNNSVRFRIRYYGFENWLRPLVLDDNFMAYIYSPPIKQHGNVNHPVDLLRAVDLADMEYLADAWTISRPLDAQRPAEQRTVLTKIIEGCFVAANRRLSTWWDDNYYPREQLDILSERAQQLEIELTNRRVAPLVPLQLLKLVKDHYIFQQQLHPEMAEFQRQNPSA